MVGGTGGLSARGYRSLFLFPPALEVACIGTQHPQHKAAVLLCLAAGKAVPCEKPMGVNAAEVHEVVPEARSRGLIPYGGEGGGNLPTHNIAPLAITKRGCRWTFLEEYKGGLPRVKMSTQ